MQIVTILNCELLQKIQFESSHNFKSPLAHTDPVLEGMAQLKLPDMYTCHLIKLYYKLYRNQLPTYFENVIPEYGESQHDLRHNNIRLPAIRCEYEKINAKYQIHYRLRKLANPSRPPLHPIVHIDMDTLSQSLRFSKYITGASPGFGREGGIARGFGGMLPREIFLKRCNLLRFRVYFDQILSLFFFKNYYFFSKITIFYLKNKYFRYTLAMRYFS